MCTVSMVMDDFWPNRRPQPIQYPPHYVDFPYTRTVVQIEDADLALIKRFLETVKRAEEFDTKNEEPDCADPEKTAVFDRIVEKLLKDLEVTVGNNDYANAEKINQLITEILETKLRVTQYK